MYNKLFGKILDSSIWLEPTPTRIVFLTLIAVMDEDGYCHFSAVANLANRARVTLPEAEQAVSILEAPDPNSADPDNEGRRIERVPGGWMVLNALKYRDLSAASVARTQTRSRVQRYRERLKNDVLTEKPRSSHHRRHDDVTLPVTLCNVTVTGRNGSETETETEEEVVVDRACAREKKQKPIFQGQRFVVFQWQDDNLIAVLGSEFDAFQLGDWYRALDTSIAGNGATDTDWPWLRKQLIREIRKRGLPLDSEHVIRAREKEKPRSLEELARSQFEFICPHEPKCRTRNQCQTLQGLGR